MKPLLFTVLITALLALNYYIDRKDLSTKTALFIFLAAILLGLGLVLVFSAPLSLVAAMSTYGSYYFSAGIVKSIILRREKQGRAMRHPGLRMVPFLVNFAFSGLLANALLHLLLA